MSEEPEDTGSEPEAELSKIDAYLRNLLRDLREDNVKFVHEDILGCVSILPPVLGGLVVPVFRADDMLGCVVHALLGCYLPRMLEKSRPFKNEDLGLAEGFFLEVTVRSWPQLARAADVSADPEEDPDLEAKAKAWWKEWSDRLLGNEKKRSDLSAQITRALVSECREAYLAPIAAQLNQAKHGILLSKERDDLEQCVKEDGPLSDEAVRIVCSSLWVALEGVPDSGVFFVTEGGKVIAGYRQVRDKLGKPGMEQKPKASLDELVPTGSKKGAAKAPLHTTLPTDVKHAMMMAKPAREDKKDVVSEHKSQTMKRGPSETRIAMESLRAVQDHWEIRELSACLRETLADLEARAKREVDRVIARHMLELASGNISLKELAQDMGIPESTLSQAKARLIKRLREDPRFREGDLG